METCKWIFLTYRKEEMLPYAHAYLKNHYPYHECGVLQYYCDEELLSPDFVIERLHNGIIHRAAVGVRSSGVIDTDHIYMLNNYEKILGNHSKCKIEKIFIVPAGYDTSMIPGDIKIIYLKEFFTT